MPRTFDHNGFQLCVTISAVMLCCKLDIESLSLPPTPFMYVMRALIRASVAHEGGPFA